MDFDKNLVNLIIMVIVIAATIAGPLIERWRRRRLEKEGEPAPEEPPPAEPMLPYEDLVDQVFGPYMRRRREVHEAKKAAAEPEIRIVVEEPEPPAPVVKEEEPPPRRLVEEAKPPAGVDKEKVDAPAVSQPASPTRAAVTLEERLFSNRRWTPAAKLVLASEILKRPRFLRPGR